MGSSRGTSTTHCDLASTSSGCSMSTDGPVTGSGRSAVAGAAAALPARDLVWIEGGTFRMGSDRHYPEERPVQDVTVDGFWMDEHEVTVAEFRRFVTATGHVTVAERALEPANYPDADPELLVPGSLVFRQTRGPV